MTLRLPALPAQEVPATEAWKLISSAIRLDMDVAEMLRRANVPYSVADFQEGRVAAISSGMYAAIYQECLLAIDTQAAASGGRSPVRQEEYALLWQSVITCRTLGNAIERATIFSRMLEGRMGMLTTVFEADNVVFQLESMRPIHTPSTFITELIGMSMFDRMYSWLIGERLPIASIDMNYDARYQEYLIPGITSRDVRFDQPAASFSFPALLLERPVIRHPDDLEALLPLTVLSVGAQPEAGPVSRRVLHQFDNAILNGAPLPTSAELARSLRFSSTSLRRRLAAEGTSIRELKDKRRLDWAIELLRQADMQIEDIAQRLGFSDATAFRRAFRQWTGNPPTYFRSGK
jgi:AraC-like DNA-binding protein